MILLFGIAPKSKQKGLGQYSKTCKLRGIARKHSKLVLRTQTPNAFFRFICLLTTVFSVRAIFDLCSKKAFLPQLRKITLALFNRKSPFEELVPIFGKDGGGWQKTNDLSVVAKLHSFFFCSALYSR